MFSCRTMQQQTICTLLLTAATTAGMDKKNLDGNVVAQLRVGFARKVSLTSITACLPAPKSVEDPLPIFVQNINVSLTLELAWQQRNNHSWAWGTDGKDGGHTRILYSWSPGVINANSIWKAKCNYLFLPPDKATGWSFNGTMPCFNVPWAITEPNDQCKTDDHSLQYTEPLNATWCIKHPEHNGSDCPNTCQEPGFKGAWEKCPLNCTRGPDWIGQRKGAPPVKTSPLWNCQTEIQCKNIDNMPLLWFYPPIREALVQGCLCSNTSYARPTALKRNAYGECPPHIPIQGVCQTSYVPAPPNLVWACSDGHLYSREAKPLQKGTWEKAKMRLGWWLEALFGMGTASVKNRQAIHDLTGQVSVFANSTSDSLALLNEQRQHTSKMTAQHRAL